MKKYEIDQVVPSHAQRMSRFSFLKKSMTKLRLFFLLILGTSCILLIRQFGFLKSLRWSSGFFSSNIRNIHMNMNFGKSETIFREVYRRNMFSRDFFKLKQSNKRLPIQKQIISKKYLKVIRNHSLSKIRSKYISMWLR